MKKAKSKDDFWFIFGFSMCSRWSIQLAFTCGLIAPKISMALAVQFGVGLVLAIVDTVSILFIRGQHDL
jgi:hypothetical protein